VLTLVLYRKIPAQNTHRTLKENNSILDGTNELSLENDSDTFVYLYPMYSINGSVSGIIQYPIWIYDKPM
jgi:hypothetical protein